MTDAQWLQLTLLCLAGAASPGLSWLIITQMSLQRGPMSGLVGAIGHGCGITLCALATIFGLNWLNTWAPGISSVLNWLGVGFLIFLGVQLCRSQASSPTQLTQPESKGFWIGLTIALLNPKVLVFFLAVFAPYVDWATTLTDRWLMGFLAGTIDALVYALVALTAASARRFLTGNRLMWMNRGIGVLILIGASSLILTTI